mgnify:CR=1 FL=1
MTLNRRAFIQSTAAVAAAASSTTLWAADTIKIGFVTPLTGPLALFGEADKWTVEQMKQSFKNGITVAGKKYSVEILIKDSQSNPNRAAEVASDLILKDKIIRSDKKLKSLFYCVLSMSYGVTPPGRRGASP